MKKFFKNNDLLKIVGLVMLFTAILTWIIPTGEFGNEFIDRGLVRIGTVDFFSLGISGMQWFLLQVTFLLVLGGFYGLLTKVKGYQALVSKVAKSIKGKEIIFVLLTSFALAFLASISTNLFQLLIFIPFLITVLLRAKVDKISAFATTFGALLIGTIGATYTPGLGTLNYYTGVTTETLMWAKIVIFFIAFATFNLFNIIHMRSTLKKAKADEAEEDIFEVEEAKGKTSIVPIAIIFGAMLVLSIIGYIDWVNTFKVEVFHNFHEWLMGIRVGDHAVFQYIVGSADYNTKAIPGEFGTWDLFMIQIVMLINTIILGLIYKVKLDEALEAFGSGVKKMLKPALILLLIISAFMIIVTSSFIPTIVNFIIGFTKSFNVYLSVIAAFITSLFSFDLGYNGYLFAQYIATTYPLHKEVIMLLVSSMYGFAGFIAPTSVILMIGLSYLDIKFTNWFKYIWKFLVVVFVALLILFTLLTYVF